MSVIRNIILPILLFASLNAYSLNSLLTKDQSQKYLATILKDKDKFSRHTDYVLKNFYREKINAKDVPAYVFVLNIVSELTRQLIKYDELLLNSRKKNSFKKAKKNRRAKEKSLKSQKKLLKEIAEQCSDYLYFRKKAGLEFFSTIVNKGFKNESLQKFVPLFLLDSMTAQKHSETCSLMTDEALAPVDNYIKLILDFFTLLIAEQPYLAEHIEPYLIVALGEKLDDDNILAYALKPMSDGNASEKAPLGPIIHSSKTPTKNDYFVFIRKENGEYMGATLSYPSKKLFWIFSKNNLELPGVFSKLYTDFKPAKNGLLFTMFGENLTFHFYQSGEPSQEITEWTQIEKRPEDRPRELAANNRLLVGFNLNLRTTVQFIEFNEAAKLQEIISEIKDAGFLDQSVFLDVIEWLLNHECNASIAHEIYPSFYPKKLIQQKRREREELIDRELIQMDKKLNKQFSQEKPQPKSPLVYQDMLNEVLGRNKSIGNRLLQKCVGWWWKAHENELKKLRQNGSHIQAEGEEGVPTTTFTFPHGPKAKFGLSSKQVKRRLKDREEDNQNY